MSFRRKLKQSEIAELDRAYQEAIYEVDCDGQIIVLGIGKHNKQLARLLRDRNCTNWALITAYNPYSQCLSVAENQQRHQKLLDDIQSRQLSILPAMGKDPTGEWTPEASVLILDISLTEAIEIGRLFEQNAIVYGSWKQSPQLQWL